MALITWTANQYGTNVGFADDEHQILFGKLNNYMIWQRVELLVPQ
jgi:hemerythrin